MKQAPDPCLYCAYPISSGVGGGCSAAAVIDFPGTGVLGSSSKSRGWNSSTPGVWGAPASVLISASDDGACGFLLSPFPSSVSVLEACCAPPPPILIPLTENLDALLEIKLPIPPLQLAIEDLTALASTADDEAVEVVETTDRVDIRLSGLNFESVGAGAGAAATGAGAAEAGAATSGSAAAPGTPAFDPGSDSFRCAVSRLMPPLTPSTARKKPVDPTASAFESVSRAGASC